MKKCLLIILSILLLASLMVTPALAAGATPTVSATNAEGKSGETVYITVSAKDLGAQTAYYVSYPTNVTVDTANCMWLLEDSFMDDIGAEDAVFTYKTAQEVSGDIFKLAVKVPAYTGTKTVNVSFQIGVKTGSTKVWYDVAATITVNNPATGIALNSSAVTLDFSGAKTAALTANVTPADTTDTVVWTSDNNAVATVADGTVTAVGEGTANITATAGSVSATCKVTVGCTHANKQTVAAKDPTCQATGNNLYYTCGDCGKVLDAQMNVTTVEAQTLAIVPCSGGTATCLNKPVCSMCGKEYGEKLPHALTHFDAVAATCSSTGKVEYWTCANAVCAGRFYTKEDCTAFESVESALVVAKNAENHSATLVHRDEVAATCSTTGTLEHWSCAGCNKNFSDAAGKTELTDLVIDKNDNHSKTAHAEVKATCSSEGKMAYWTCSGADCAGKFYTKEDFSAYVAAESELILLKDAANHSATLVHHDEIPATCSTTGTKEYWSCAGCGKNFSDAAGKTELTDLVIDKNDNHSKTAHAEVKATCSSEGKMAYWTCSGADCAGKFYTKEDFSAYVAAESELILLKDAANHSAALTHHEKVAATCSATGTEEYWSCADCAKNFSNEAGTTELSNITIAINPDNHKLTYHAAVTPTCSAKGNVEYWTCDYCAKFFDKADGKNPVAKETLILNEDPTNHVKLTAHAAKTPNCSEEGNIAYWTCSGTACAGKYFSDAAGTQAVSDIKIAIDPTNHKQLTGHNAVAGTCQQAGNVAYWTCSGSNCAGINYGDNKGLTKLDSIVDPINPDNHVGSTYHAPKAATCIATGNVEYWTCTNTACAGKYFSDAACTVALADYVTAINPDNHTGGTVVKNKKAENCYQSGYSGDTHCASCDVLLKAGQVINPTGNHVAGSAWYNDDNNHWHICTTQGCGAQVGKAAHTFQWKVDKAATEDETGLKHEECVCGKKRNEGTVIEKLDHVHVGITHHAAVKATCTKTGTVEYWTCSSSKCTGKYYGDKDCQLVLETIVESINASNHVGKTEVKDAVEATCAKDGYTGDTYCVDCKAMVKKGEKISATGKHTAKDGYLTNEKSHWQECSVCGQVIDFAKAEHTFTWVTDKNATEYAEGEKHEQCTVCKYKRNEKTVIAKLPHVPSLVVGNPATCTEEGLAEHFYCYNCGQYYASNDGQIGSQITKADTVLAAAGHAYGDEWMCDGEYHWKECECGEISGKAAHETEVIGAVEASEVLEGYTGDTVCSVCDYVVKTGETIPMIEVQPSTEAPTEAPTEPVTVEEESSGFGGILAVTGGGLGLLALILLLLKKRKKAE